MTFDPIDTTVEEIHEIICNDAVIIANDLISQNTRIPRKYKGPVFRNGSPYNEGNLTLEITEEYQNVPMNIKRYYQIEGAQAVRMSVVQNQELFVGMIFGEARAGRNYFDRWEQVPETLF